MYRWLLLVAVLVAALCGLAIGVLNPHPVTLELSGFAPTLPLGALVLLAFGSGVMVGLILFWILFDLPARFRRRKGSISIPGSSLRPGNE
jgi:uncharacterized integral membrane protein